MKLCWLSTVGFLVALSSFCAGSYRLPLEVLPLHYDIQLVPYLDEGDVHRSFTFDGNVSILVKALRADKSITLHARDVTFKATPTVSDVVTGSGLPLEGVVQDTEKDFLILKTESMTPGRLYRVNISYTGRLNDDLAGFYRSSYTLPTGEKRWLATTQFEPTDARLAFPCFDEPALKATFNISIARLPEMTSLANMPLLTTTGPDPNLNGRYWDIYQQTLNMSTYLVAFVVSDFKAVQNGTYRVWAKPSSAQYGKYALEFGPKAIKVMENFTGISYQLPKMDQIAIPDFAAGAMENWGLVTYQERYLLLTKDSESLRYDIATTVTHEFAHQWFGDLVTLNWWKFTWLNEGFANFFQFYATNVIYPQWNLLERQVSKQFEIMSSDSRLDTVSMTRDVATPAEIRTMFGAISYTKGGCVLKMIQHALGSSTFFKGLHHYLKARSYQNAVADDLFAGLQEAVDEDGALPKGLTVKDIMDSWTLQKGYPVVTVTRDYKKGTAHVDQARFITDSSQRSDERWNIPISYTTSQDLDFNDTRPNLWLTQNSTEELKGLPGEDQWIILNKNATGYFRVNYDKNNWKLLQIQLNSSDFNKIPKLNRMQLLSDSKYFAEAGLLDLDTAMDITSYLQWETDPAPWSVAFGSLEELYVKMSGSPVYPALQKFYLPLLNRLYDTVGFSQNPGENYPITLIRRKLLHWACLLGHEGCIRMARTTVRNMRNAVHDNRVSKELPDTLYCATVRSEGEVSWNWLWDLYQTTDNVKDRQKILRALGCTTDKKLITRLLSLSTDENSGLRPEDRLNVFSAACSGRDAVSCDTTLRFLATRIHRLANLFGEYESVATVLHRIASKLKTSEQLEYLRFIITTNRKHLSDAEVITTSAVSIAEGNVEWFKTKGADIVQWFIRQ